MITPNSIQLTTLKILKDFVRISGTEDPRRKLCTINFTQRNERNDEFIFI